MSLITVIPNIDWEHVSDIIYLPDVSVQMVMRVSTVSWISTNVPSTRVVQTPNALIFPAPINATASPATPVSAARKVTHLTNVSAVATLRQTEAAASVKITKESKNIHSALLVLFLL